MSAWAYVLGGVLAVGALLVWVVYRHEVAYYTVGTEGDVAHPEKVVEAYFARDDSAGLFFLYELIKTRSGYTFRCSDGLSGVTMWEGSGRHAGEAIGEAGWEALRKALEE